MNITKQEALRLIDERPDLFSGIERHCAQFKRWLHNNEHVLQAFEKYAIELRDEATVNTIPSCASCNDSAGIHCSVKRVASGN